MTVQDVLDAIQKDALGRYSGESTGGPIAGWFIQQLENNENTPDNGVAQVVGALGETAFFGHPVDAFLMGIDFAEQVVEMQARGEAL